MHMFFNGMGGMPGGRGGGGGGEEQEVQPQNPFGLVGRLGTFRASWHSPPAEQQPWHVNSPWLFAWHLTLPTGSHLPAMLCLPVSPPSARPIASMTEASSCANALPLQPPTHRLRAAHARPVPPPSAVMTFIKNPWTLLTFITVLSSLWSVIMFFVNR